MKVFAYVGAFVLFTALSFPLSAGAWGRSPSSSEVNQTSTTTQTASKTATTTTETDGSTQKVPEPSSGVLFAVGIIAIVTLKRRFSQMVKK